MTQEVDLNQETTTFLLETTKEQLNYLLWEGGWRFITGIGSVTFFFSTLSINIPPLSFIVLCVGSIYFVWGIWYFKDIPYQYHRIQYLTKRNDHND